MRNVAVRNAGLALAALVLAGCTGGSTSSAPPPSGTSGASSPSGTSTSSSAPTTLSSPVQPPPQSSAAPLPGPTEVPAAQVDGSTLSDLYKRQAWTSSDGRTLQVVGLGGGCKTASAEVTAQSADQVQITLVTTYYPPEGGVCTQEVHDVPLNVTLDAPLGDRRVVLEAREQTG
jgi:hypothetical protein